MEITKEVLDRLRKHQQKEYFGSQAQSMFVDGVFNYDNWNGGDGLIRQYFYHNSQQSNVEYVEFDWLDTRFSGDVIITHSWYDDQNYVTVVLSGYYDNDDPEIDNRIEDVVYFTWYKSRGRTESAKYNGKLMTEEQYLFVLNAIAATGFEFDLD